MTKETILGEIYRRNVPRTAVAYGVAAWLILQIVDVIAEIVGLPRWASQLTFLLILAGFPVTIVLAWFFDLTAAGIERDDGKSPPVEMRINSDSGSLKLHDCIACFSIAFIGLGLSVGAGSLIHLQETHQIERAQEKLADDFAREIHYLLSLDSEVLETLSVLFLEEQLPEFAMFESLAENLLSRHPELKAVEWVPRVEHSRLEEFNSSMNDVYPGYKVKSVNSNIDKPSLDSTDIHYPVSFTMPKEGNESAIGLDLASEPARAAALFEAARTGTSRQSKSVVLIQTGRPGFLLVNPVYASGLNPLNDEIRLQTLKGFCLGVIDAAELAAEVLFALESGSNFQGHVRIFEDHEEHRISIVSIDNSGGLELSDLQRVATIDNEFGGHWTVEVVPTQAMVTAGYSSLHYIVGVVGTLLSIGLAILSQIIITRAKTYSGKLAKMSSSVTSQDITA